MSPIDLETPLEAGGTLVVGAGQAGLAIGYKLREQGLPFQIVDAADEIGAVWRDRWDSLRLITAAQYNSLPGMDFPAAADTYPGKEEVVNFLQAYAAEFELPEGFGASRLGQGRRGVHRPGNRCFHARRARRNPRGRICQPDLRRTA